VETIKPFAVVGLLEDLPSRSEASQPRIPDYFFPFSTKGAPSEAQYKGTAFFGVGIPTSACTCHGTASARATSSLEMNWLAR
jgi:hypothetical protein